MLRMTAPPLSDVESRLLASLEEARARRSCRHGDVAVRRIYLDVFGRWPEPTMSRRQQQQRVGSYISRLNRKIAPNGLRVATGVARSSYRLVELT